MSQNFIKDYRAWGSGLTDAPPMYHYMGAISAISTVLGNQVWVQYGSQKLYPNLYILLLGPSSAYRKTTSINMAKKIVAKVNPDKILPNEFSYEALLDILSRRPQGTFYYSEFHTLAGLLSKDYMAGTKAFLADIYDSPPVYERKTKGYEIKLENPCLSILSASTQAWFLKGLQEEDFMSGFLARFVILSEMEKLKSIAWPRGSDTVQENDLVRQLKAISELKGEMNVSTQVKMQFILNDGICEDLQPVRRIYEDWYCETWEPEYLNRQSSLFRPFFERLATTCIKFAMIFAVSKGRTDILEEDFWEAQKLTEGLANGLLILEGEEIVFGKAQAQRKKVRDIIRQSPNTTREYLLRQSRLSAKELDEAVNTLRQSGEIDWVSQRNEGARKPVTCYVPKNGDV